MMQGLLSEAMPQDPAMSQNAGMGQDPMAQEGATMSDVDMAVEDAMMSGGMEDVGFGVEMASEEEHQMLEEIMDGVEDMIHGENADQVAKLLDSSPEPYQGISMASHTIAVAAYLKANKEGLEPSPDIFLAENGVIQETVELVFEVAEAMGKVTVDDDDELNAAYMDTLRLVGETLLEGENPEVVASAQELLVELELGTPISEEDYGDETVAQYQMGQQGMGMEEQMGGMQGQAPMPPAAPEQGGGMPPMAPNQGII